MIPIGCKFYLIGGRSVPYSIGKFESNVERDLTRWLKHVYDVDIELYMLTLKLAHRLWLEPVEIMVPVIPPHDRCSNLYKQTVGKAPKSAIIYKLTKGAKA